MSSKDEQEELRALGHIPKPVLKAIKAHCLGCSNGNRAEAENCIIKDCNLYPLRLGKNRWRPEPSEATREVRRRNAAKLNNPVNPAE